MSLCNFASILLDAQFSSLSLCESLPRLLDARDNKSTYGKEELFEGLKQEAVAELSDLLIKLRQNPGRDPNHYMEFLKKAGELRNRMAVKTETSEAELFGSLRHEHNMISPLYAVRYKEVNEKIKQLILKCLKNIKNKEKGVRETRGVSRYTFRLETEEQCLLKNLAPIEKMQQTAKCREDYLSTGLHNRIDEVVYKLMVIDEYRSKIKPLEDVLTGLNEPANSIFDKNIYVYSGVIELEVNKEWRTLTRHYTVISCDNKGIISQEHINRFKANGFVSLLHTSHEDFNFHAEPIAQLFDKIVDRETPKEQLYSLIRDFEYRLHHICYFKRGSAAINEMVLEAIQKVICPDYKIKGNLEALAEPFISLFMK